MYAKSSLLCEHRPKTCALEVANLSEESKKVDRTSQNDRTSKVSRIDDLLKKVYRIDMLWNNSPHFFIFQDE